MPRRATPFPELVVAKNRLAAVLAFADHVVRQPNGSRLRKPGREIDLHLHGMRLDTDERA